MKKIILIFILFLRGTHGFAGVGDVYYCVNKGDSVDIYQNQFIEKTFVEKNKVDYRFSFKWEETGIRGGTTYKIGKDGEKEWELAPFEWVAPADEAFVTKTKDGQIGLSQYNKFLYNDNRLTKITVSNNRANVSFYRCDKFQ